MKTIRAGAVIFFAAWAAWAQDVPLFLAYQGRLLDGTNLVNGNVPLSLRLMSAPVGGAALYEDSNSVAVVDGLYATFIGDDTVSGSLTNALASGTAYLETMVGGVALAPRERIASVAFAMNARIASGVSPGAITASSISNATIVPANLNVGSFTTTFWKVDGNAGTSAGSHFVGTTDNQPLELRVNGARAQRIESASTPNIIGGSPSNSTGGGVSGAVISGGGATGLANQVSANYGAIGGGASNSVASGATHSFIGGGQRNSARGTGSFIGGGSNNVASGQASVVAGGENNLASGGTAVIGGGAGNDALSLASVVAGGSNNTASNSLAAIGGGIQNTAAGYASAIGGGANNIASKDYAFIGGGSINTAGYYGTVIGGYNNAATGSYATVVGGFNNTAAGFNSFAAGNRARANHGGAFVFGDTNNVDVASTNASSWTVRCVGGARFITAMDGTGVILGIGANQWASMSDRNAKENFAPVDSREVLDKVAAMPVTTWNMKAQDPSVRHIGPMAQDFHSAFGLGDNERYIGTSDADGVALAAIQGLYGLVREQREEINRLRAEVDALKTNRGAKN